MDIYIVAQGDNINTISARFGMPVEKITVDNGLIYPYQLVVGQSLVIAYPKQTYVVRAGDTLQEIADANQVPVMQILRNNHNLSLREYIYPGETLIISYETSGSIITNGFAFPFMKQDTLLQTLPNLTYLSIFNYTTTEKGEIIAYQDDTKIIETAKEYSTIPLLLFTTLSVKGEPNVETAYRILMNEEYQERNTNELVSIMKNKGYLGINIILNYLNMDNQQLYLNFMQRISKRLRQENLLFFITINYRNQVTASNLDLEQVDYTEFGSLTDGFIFLELIWGRINASPTPVINMNSISMIINYVTSEVPAEQVHVGMPTIGYDWQLPYVQGHSDIVSMNFNTVLNLAYNVDAVIQFDDYSQTPYFYYTQSGFNYPFEHVVWFIDARSIYVLNQIVKEYGLSGSGIWNVMLYNPQLWTIINAEFDIIKLL